MKFIHITRCGEDYDPRSHYVARWKCDVCGYDHLEAHVNKATYNTLAEKKCPKCGAYSVEDRIHALKLRKTEKRQVVIDTENEIKAICAELEGYGIRDDIETICSTQQTPQT